MKTEQESNIIEYAESKYHMKKGDCIEFFKNSFSYRFVIDTIKYNDKGKLVVSGKNRKSYQPNKLFELVEDSIDWRNLLYNNGREISDLEKEETTNKLTDLLGWDIEYGNVGKRVEDYDNELKELEEAQKKIDEKGFHATVYLQKWDYDVLEVQLKDYDNSRFFKYFESKEEDNKGFKIFDV